MEPRARLAPPTDRFGAVALVLLTVTALSTLLPWTTSDEGSVLGIRHDDAFLVIAAALAGVVLYRMGIRAAWIAPGFAAVVQFRDIRRVLDADVTVGLGLWLGLGAAVAAAAVLIADLVATIRAEPPDAAGAED